MRIGPGTGHQRLVASDQRVRLSAEQEAPSPESSGTAAQLARPLLALVDPGEPLTLHEVCTPHHGAKET